MNVKDINAFVNFLMEQLTRSQRAFKAKAHLLDWYSLEQDMRDPVFKQTGRTQVIAVCTIMTALLEPSKPVEIHDHAGRLNGGKLAMDDQLRKRIQSILEKAHLASVDWPGMFVITKTTVTFVAHECSPTMQLGVRVLFTS